jgi:hypothetical protein
MNPYYGYQICQAQRTETRAEILAGDARLGRQAAAVFRGSRALAGKASTPAIMALNAIRAMMAQVTTAPQDGDRAGSPASRNLSRRGTRDY